MSRILVVDDEPSLREFLSILIRKAGHTVDTAASGAEAIVKTREQEYAVIFTDMMMPGEIDGIGLLRHVRKESSSTQVIVVTAFATTETAIQAMKLGAYDYIQKPFKIEEIETLLEKCLEKQALVEENAQLKNELQSKYHFGNLIGKSEPMLALFDMLRKVVNTKVNVLILGESGTGKELVARALHYNSHRSERPFVAVNCGAIPEHLLESELFGHVKGAFTGADRSKPGLFRTAEGGTLFLDEIGELPLHIQVKLLRVLQEKKLRPVGSAEVQEVDVRIISATNKNLTEEVKEGRFREDLFFRLNVLNLVVPPLRDRKDDIPLLGRHFLGRFCEDMGRSIQGISDDAMEMLFSHDYPGNVRELENIIERAVLLESGDMISTESLPPTLQSVHRAKSGAHVIVDVDSLTLPPEGLELFLEGIERRLLKESLRQSGGVRKEAAKLLKLSSRSFRYRVAKLNLQMPGD